MDSLLRYYTKIQQVVFLEISDSVESESISLNFAYSATLKFIGLSCPFH